MPEDNQSTFYRTVLRHARDKPELEDVPRMTEEDYQWPKEFSPQKSIIRKESPANVLRKYYGDDLEMEVMRARTANNYLRHQAREGAILAPGLYSKIFEDFPVHITQTGSGRFYPDKEQIEIASRPDVIYEKERWDRDIESLNDPSRDNTDMIEGMREFLRMNSYRSDLPFSGAEDTLEHELGHAWARPVGRNRLAFKPENVPLHMRQTDWNISPIYGADAGPRGPVHMEKAWETVQAAGRLQREHFKATGSRLKPGEFTKLVASPEVPDYLSNEGNRLLQYAKDTIKKIDHLYEYGARSREAFSGEKLPKEDRDRRAKAIKKHFLERLETILPTTVKAEDVEQPSQIRRI